MLPRERQQETQWRSVWERSDLHNSLAAITSRCSTVTSLHLCFHSCETDDIFCFHISAVLFPQFRTGYFHSCKTADTCYFIPNWPQHPIQSNKALQLSQTKQANGVCSSLWWPPFLAHKKLSQSQSDLM